MKSFAESPYIHIRGARTHNLKNIDVDIPRQQLVVITGLSGSGKSSLAFDTLYAEGQRRYVESLSAYARQFLDRMEKPDVDLIEGLSPAIAIEQKATSHNPRSTVGTVTEIYDYLRLLFARIGTPYCPDHLQPLRAQSVMQMVDTVLTFPAERKILILAPIARQRKGEFTEQITQLQSQGYVRFRLNGAVYEAQALPKLKKNEKHDLDVVIDRLKVRPEVQQRLSESLETALRLGEGRAMVLELPDQGAPVKHLFSARYACSICDYCVPELEPRLFSFNSPVGACPTCDGLGLIAPEENTQGYTCTACQGTRLQPQARHVTVGEGEQKRAIFEITHDNLQDNAAYFSTLQLQGAQAQIADKIVREIESRLRFLNDVGLDYLTLERSTQTLSGGEAQRIRLASQIGSGLCGVMYVLDEPSIGLHQCDNERLLTTLKRLRDLGNSVIVVEHDEDIMRSADYLIDMGPGAGVHGGQIVGHGTAQQLEATPSSLTGQYLSGALTIPVPSQRRKISDETPQLRIQGASGHNLKNVDVAIPVGRFTCVTGVSGSGKSTLINDTLYLAAAQHLHRQEDQPAPYSAIEGLEHFDKIINVDQSPIGRTPRSNPATYTGLLTPIRELYAQLPTAKERGYTAARFSFNVAGGRCEMCQGEGVMKVEMHFLPDIYVSCDSCHGQRYQRETLDIQYKGKNIAQVLALTVQDARTFFSAIPNITRKLQTLLDVGLGYITLGQAATTLSGGEAQRVKLALELSKRDSGRTLYILDEPTTGLHFADTALLLRVLHQLCDAGNTIVIIEHNLDVIKTADWVIDLGPRGGTQGGRIMATGTPETLAKEKNSDTGQYLKAVLKARTAKG